MFTESALLPISALQHLVFCPRQCALIHLERLWAENRFTVEGRHLHTKADRGGAQRRGDLFIARTVPLRSLRLGLFGAADVVERTLHAGQVRLLPVEYKRGAPKSHDADRVQLCAQALCLEEMTGLSIAAGALFYGKTRRRLDVPLDPPLRAKTEAAAAQLHAMFESRRTPPAMLEKKCKRCSLIDLCMPGALHPRRTAAVAWADAVAAALAGPPAAHEDPP